MSEIQSILQKTEQLVKDKREKYGKAVDVAAIDMLKTLFPDGIQPTDFDSAIFLVRICEKLGRIASKNIDPKARNDAYRDIAGYALLALDKDSKNGI